MSTNPQHSTASTAIPVTLSRFNADRVLPPAPMVVDCDTCQIRGKGCLDCPIAALLDPTEALHQEERTAIGALQDAGLIGPPHLSVVRLPTASGAPTARAG